SQTIDIPPAANTNIVVPLPSLMPGWHTVVTRINNVDGFALDDAHYLIMHTPERQRGLCVESRPGARSSEQEKFFFAMALNPFSDGTNGTAIDRTAIGFALEKCARDEILSEVAGGPAAALIVIPGMRQIPEGCGKTLASYVNNGGGLLMF